MRDYPFGFQATDVASIVGVLPPTKGGTGFDDTSGAVDDILVRGATNYARKAKGAAGTYFRVTQAGTLGYFVRPDFTPFDHGLLTWAFDPALATVSTPAWTPAGTLFTARLHLPEAASITNIVTYVSVVGVTLTAGQCFLAVYQGAGGTLLGTTADQAAAWVSTGIKTAAISGGPVAAAAGDIYVAGWYNGTTAPRFLGAASGAGAAGLANVGIAAASSRYGTADTGKTTTAPGTLGTISANATSWWVGLS